MGYIAEEYAREYQREFRRSKRIAKDIPSTERAKADSDANTRQEDVARDAAESPAGRQIVQGNNSYAIFECHTTPKIYSSMDRESGPHHKQFETPVK